MNQTKTKTATKFDFRKGLGEQMASIRKDKGLTVEQLAERMGVQPKSVENVESGAFKFDVDHLYGFARALGFDIVLEVK